MTTVIIDRTVSFDLIPSGQVEIRIMGQDKLWRVHSMTPDWGQAEKETVPPFGRTLIEIRMVTYR